MNKKQKIEYIENVRARIQYAKNHGRNGGDWWYPTQWTVAYDVKIHTRTKNVDDIRANMSAIQRRYYTDDDLYNVCNDMLEQECDFLRETLLDMPLVEAVRFAGRSGGWCEVTYTALEYTPSDLNDCTAQDINALYKNAKALNDAESNVRETITNRHKDLCVYLNTDEYVDSVVDQLLSEDDIITIKREALDEYMKLKA